MQKLGSFLHVIRDFSPSFKLALSVVQDPNNEEGSYQLERAMFEAYFAQPILPKLQWQLDTEALDISSAGFLEENYSFDDTVVSTNGDNQIIKQWEEGTFLASSLERARLIFDAYQAQVDAPKPDIDLIRKVSVVILAWGSHGFEIRPCQVYDWSLLLSKQYE